MTNPDQPQTAPAPPRDDGDGRRTIAAGLLEQIIDHLPIALTVQDADGRFWRFRRTS
jgi:hypothetical protein